MSENFSYTVKLQKRKTLMIYVLPDGAVEVRAPLRMPQARIVAFVEQRAAWVVKTRAKQLHRQRWQLPIEPGGGAWFLGEVLTVAVERGSAFAVAREPQRLLVRARNPDDLPALARAVNDWYREQAEQVFGERLMALCALFPELAVPELRLRRMRRRWGSCSRSGRVTLNIELVKLPPELVDYVIVHELCHLFEFNHGPRFYRLLGRVMPEWQRHETLLKQF